MGIAQKWEKAIEAGYRICRTSKRWAIYHEIPGSKVYSGIRMSWQEHPRKADAIKAAVAMFETDAHTKKRAELARS